MEWSTDVVIEFLDHYEREPCIWNPQNEDHKDRSKVFEAWQRIQSQLSIECSFMELKKKKDALMSTYRKLAGKVIRSAKSGRSAMDIYKPEWFAYEKMSSFLDSVYKPRQLRTSDDEVKACCHMRFVDEQDNSLSNNYDMSDPLENSMVKVEGTHVFADPEVSVPDDGVLPPKRKRNTEYRIKQPTESKDESSLFCDLLLFKLRSLDEGNRQIAMHQINNIMFELVKPNIHRSTEKPKLNGYHQQETSGDESSHASFNDSNESILDNINASDYLASGMTFDKTMLLKKMECAEEITKSLDAGIENKCGTVWDGIMCWPAGYENIVSSQPCPKYFVGFDRNANATRTCTEEGWWLNPETNNTWTNYTECISSQYVTMPSVPETSPIVHLWVPWIKNLSKTGYIVSLISLTISCLILISNRRLRCPRNVLHLHLFLSFLMRATMAILKDQLFVEGVGFSTSILFYDENISYTDSSHSWNCKVLTTFWQYSIMANYAWILVEGVYLHNLIFMALFTDTSSIVIYLVLGWLIPALLVIPWAVARVFFDDTYCWTMNENQYVYLIIRVPTVISYLINFILFVNITRVLFLKLKNSSSNLVNRRVSNYKRWAKSTMVLMPLYGVHYALLLGLSYFMDPVVEIIWLLCDQIFASSQGLFVSILYCLLNGEVVQVMKTNWGSFRARLIGQEETMDIASRRHDNATAEEHPHCGSISLTH